MLVQETKRSPRRCPPRDDGLDGKAVQKTGAPTKQAKRTKLCKPKNPALSVAEVMKK